MRIQIINNEKGSENNPDGKGSGAIEINKNIITLRGVAADLLHRAMQVADECNGVVEIRRSECTVIVAPDLHQEE